jgi:hypothetical protein
MDEIKNNTAEQSPHLIKLFIAIGATLYFLYYIRTSTDWHFIDNVNLIIHEAGHTLCFFFGQFIQILAGSALQILFPTTFSLYFYIKGDYYSSSLLLFWIGQNIINVSIYVSDSIIMQLPLLGGDNVIHDWNYILSRLGILQYANRIGSFMFLLGIITIIIASYFSITTSQREKEKVNNLI